MAPVPGCTYGNDTYFSAGDIFRHRPQQPIDGSCIPNQATMQAGPGDGKPDGFANPVRRYQAFEVEFDKRFSNHWLAVVNYRFANLWGNYEGAYRNDNGQSDPGISSLFDFTTGALGLLGDQFRPGFLSTDRRSVGNMFLSYTVGSDSPFVHFAKGLTTGVGLRGQSGVPLSFLGDHPAYLNQGEVPIGGRGAAGRTPSALQLDLKGEYALPVKEGKVLKLALDAFNVSNSQFITGKVQYTQQPATSYPVVGASADAEHRLRPPDELPGTVLCPRDYPLRIVEVDSNSTEGRESPLSSLVVESGLEFDFVPRFGRGVCACLCWCFILDGAGRRPLEESSSSVSALAQRGSELHHQQHQSRSTFLALTSGF